MFDYLLDEAQKKIRDEVRDFVRWVPREMIIAHEWYRERLKRKATAQERDYEADAPEAFAEDEKIYE
jgi:hypothetical protein